MRFKQFIIIPFIVAALAFTIQCVDQLLASYMPIKANLGFGWIAFIAWPLYFLAGCDAAGGRKVFYGFVIGIVASIGIMEMGGALSGSLGFFAFPSAIFVFVTLCLCLERCPPFDLIPAIFVGAGVFFGTMTYVPGATYLTATATELIYCVIGLSYGWLAIVLRTKYEASLNLVNE